MEWSEVFNAVIALVGVTCTSVLIPFVKSKLTEAQQAKVDKWVKTAVSAAEQIYGADGAGSKKKAYVLNFLKGRGIKVDEEQINALLEAMVYELKKICLSRRGAE